MSESVEVAEEPAAIRVAIVEDHPAIADGLAALIHGSSDVSVVGTARDVHSASALIEQESPDIVLCDIRLADATDGFDLVGRNRPGPDFIILSAYWYPSYHVRAVELGAKGYLSKQAARQEICDGIAAVAGGGTALAPEVQTGLASELHERERGQQGPVLTAREREVLKLVAAGHSAPEIAERIHLSPATVKSHLQAIYDKLGVAERAAAVAEGMRRGFLE